MGHRCVSAITRYPQCIERIADQTGADITGGHTDRVARRLSINGQTVIAQQFTPALMHGHTQGRFAKARLTQKRNRSIGIDAVRRTMHD